MTVKAGTSASINGNGSYSANLKRILVMDRDPNLRCTYQQALRRVGYEVFMAVTTYEARVFLDTYDFDVFLSDTHMGHRDCGIDLLRERSAVLLRNGIQIIMMSQDATYEPICEEVGANLFVEKPIAADRLVALVDSLVA